MKPTFKNAVFVTLTAIVAVGAYVSFDYFYLKAPGLPAAPKTYKIGFLALGDKDVESENFIGFKKHMEKLGYIEGQNIQFLIKKGDRNIKGDLERVASELNNAGLDLILTGGTTPTLVLKGLADLKTPVFFLSAAVPKTVVSNLAVPEGLITGISEGVVSLAGKRLGLLKEIVPEIKTVATIIEKNHPTGAAAQENIEIAAKNLGIKTVVIEIEAGKQAQILDKLKTVTKANGIDAYIACTCSSNERYAKELAEHFRLEKIPSVNAELDLGAKLGWLATYSNNRMKTGELAAESVNKILKGAPVSAVPVEFTQDVVLELNLATAEAIGVKIPKAVFLLANKTYNR